MKLHRLFRSRAGFTLAETIITAAIALGGIGAAMTLNGAHLKLVKSSRQSNAATLALQERVEQLRVVGWSNLINESYVKDIFLLKSPESAAVLDGAKERVVISPYVQSSGIKNLIVDRDASGNRSTVSDGAGLTNEENSIVKVELQLKWTGSDGRERTRAMTTVVSNGGISMSNLPAMGTVSGGTNTSNGNANNSSGDSGGTEDNGGTGDSGETGDGGTVSDEPPKNNPGNSGSNSNNGNNSSNGNNGRGNVNGKPGTK